LGYFSGFRPLRALLRQGFYINPSRRGPAVPAGGSPTPPGGRGTLRAPERQPPPLGVAARHATS